MYGLIIAQGANTGKYTMSATNNNGRVNAFFEDKDQNRWTSGATPQIYSSTPKINYAGGGQAHSNMQPYITCYMWKRTT